MRSFSKAICVASAVLCFNLSVSAQDISLKMKDITVKEAIAQIKKTTGYTFVFSSIDLDTKKKVNLSLEDATIDETMKQLLQGQKEVGYEIIDKKIVIKRVANQQTGKPIKAKGHVVDVNGEPVIGATVRVQGTTKGAITDIDGNFAIDTNEKAMLEISFVGYKTQLLEATGGKVLAVTMKEDTEMLDEVVVIGYGTMRKKDLTGAVAQIKPTNMMKEGISSVQDLLRTGVPGLNVGTSSSAKGGGSLQVRGQRSLSGSNDPLIVVDNVIFSGELSEINPQDIEQVDVLKDASSAAVFGARSANGVIIITTKKGKQGKPTVNFNANFGIIANNQTREVYDAQGYLDFRSAWYESKEGFENLGKYRYPSEKNLEKYGLTLDEWRAFTSNQDTSDEDIYLSRLGLFDKEKENYFAGRTYNWFDEVYRTGFRQDYSASISGAAERVNYYFSMGYLDSKGQVVGDDYRAIRSNLKVEATAADFLTIGANVNFQNRTDGNLAAGGGMLTSNSPYALPYDEEGNLVLYPMGENSLNTGSNYRFDRQYQDLERGYTVLNSVLTAKLKLPFNIKYTVNFRPRFQWYHNRYHASSQHPLWQDTKGSVDRGQSYNFSWLVNNTLNWEYTFGKKHNVNVTLAQEAEESRSYSDAINARWFTPTDALGLHYVGGADKMKSDFSSSDSHSTGASYLGRFFYSYDNKYMLTYTVRRDGYSAFGTSNPWANFMSAAGAWTFTEEKFFNWEPMNYGKLRLSWGSNGNRAVGTYAALSNLTGGTGFYSYVNPDGSLNQVSMLYVSRMANPNLKWERTTSWNVGLDFGFFDNRINGSIEYYHMPTTDLVMSQSLSNITGFSSITTNLGEVLNQGFEFTLNTRNIQNENFEWNSSIGVSLNRNQIKHLYYTYEDVLDDNGNVIGRKEIDDQKNGWFIGKDINEIWGYKYQGIWQLGQEEEAALYKQKPGDPKFLDKYDIDNHRYSNEDKVFQGSTSPRFRWTFRNDFTLWKDLTVSVNIYSKWGMKGGEEFITSGDSPERGNVYETEYWTPDNPTNKYARLGASNVSGGSRIIDRSFIRLENIALEYNVPKRFLSKFNIQGLRLSGSVRNVACWTKEYQCNDPEYGDVVPVTVNFGIGLTL